MDDQDKFFFRSQMDFFGQESPVLAPQLEGHPLFSSSSSGKEEKVSKQIEQPSLKAYNPMDHLKNIPESRHNDFLNYFSNHKALYGIQHFFGFGQDGYQHSGQFLQNIESDALGDNNLYDFEIGKLFHGENKESYREAIQSNLQELHKKIQDVNNKTIGSLNIGKTISNAFYQHFENFTLVINSSNFIHEFTQNFKNMMTQFKKIKGPGNSLIVALYEFWQRSFKDLINQMWKYSSKFTLNFFKKNEPQEVDSSNASSNAEMRSESSFTVGSKEKRKGWTKEQNEYLMKFIDSNIIFTQSVLKNIASYCNRSISSVSSKIQKLIKARKSSESQEESLLKKTLQILKMHEQGLTRQTIVEKLNQHYEMGYGGQWEKSVGQLLSSKKEFIRIRGKHKLINPENFAASNDEHHKLTFKDKVIQIFLGLPGYEGELKTLVDRYISKYGQGELEGGELANEDRRKTIQGNISKTLSRYDIFDNSKAKTKYVLNPLYKPITSSQMQVQSFFAL